MNQLKAKDEARDKDQKEFERRTTAAAEEYVREKDATAKRLSNDIAALAERFAQYEDQYARDKAVAAEAHCQEKRRHELEFSHLVQELDIMKSWISSSVILSSFPCIAYKLIARRYNLQDKGAMAVHIHSQTVSNNAMRSLCHILKLPTYEGGTNAPVVFRNWLDKGVATLRAAKFTGKSSVQSSGTRGVEFEDDEDSLRKQYLKAFLSKFTEEALSGQKYHTQRLEEQSPTIHALHILSESEEALDILTQKNIKREEGNYAAHPLNLNSLEQVTLQLEQPDGQLHMTEASVKAMQELVRFCQADAGQFPPEMPPAGSTLWTSGK